MKNTVVLLGQRRALLQLLRGRKWSLGLRHGGLRRAPSSEAAADEGRGGRPPPPAREGEGGDDAVDVKKSREVFRSGGLRARRDDGATTAGKKAAPAFYKRMRLRVVNACAPPACAAPARIASSWMRSACCPCARTRLRPLLAAAVDQAVPMAAAGAAAAAAGPGPPSPPPRAAPAEKLLLLLPLHVSPHCWISAAADLHVLELCSPCGSAWAAAAAADLVPAGRRLHPAHPPQQHRGVPAAWSHRHRVDLDRLVAAALLFVVVRLRRRLAASPFSLMDPPPRM